MDPQAIARFFSLPEEQRRIRNSNASFRMEGEVPVSFPLTARSWGARTFIESPVSMFSSYERSYAEDLPTGLHRFLVSNVSPALTFLLQMTKADRTVFAHNLPFPTVLHFRASSESLLRDVLEVRERTKRPVAIRSLNEIEHQRELQVFSESGFIIVPARQVNVVVDPEGTAKRLQLVRRELRLIERQPELELVETNTITADEASVMADLYERLYIQKYSRENPDYSPDFIRSCVNSGLQSALVLRHRTEGIVGFTTFYENSTTLAGTLLGYSMPLNSEYPLYRIMMIALYAQALKASKCLNWSGGSAHFKSLRGAVPCMEYLCVLPRTFGERLVFTALRKMMGAVLAGKA